ncbi:hypothetical protein MJO28_003642 [Puccinia striiformis f. sp. tritici]|uniref:Uncharacterized protein n=1 Tax=Puccinia striiformis f. sp. tritici TaxID=168172 RepID=A0ACC0EQ55_9BASI|nr:hypothetical protein MJO28_003642 [Puccinia striiformis f. sp. tritici]KAI9610933.1 hypothetical protein H4Q26_008779 [Puccinia striiformis f. sp. tritici PST-130]
MNDNVIDVCQSLLIKVTERSSIASCAAILTHRCRTENYFGFASHRPDFSIEHRASIITYTIPFLVL